MLGITRFDVVNYVDAVFLVYTILLVGYVISSFIFSLGARPPYSPPLSAVLGFLRDVSEPYLRIFRRFLPNIGMFDISPIVALIVLSLVRGLVDALIRG
ncbi:MAG: YggT family protein [Solirubrobacteraceae bacterium]